MHVYTANNHARDGNKDTSKAKALQPSISNYQCTVTYTVLLVGTRRHIIHSKEKKKRPPHRQGSQTGPLGSLWRGTWETERVPRDRAGYLHPRGSSMGRVATSVPTAASIAAAELGPIRVASELSPALLPRTRRFA